VVGPFSTTILPPTPRPTGRLPRGFCRYNTRYYETYNCRYFQLNILPNNDANDLRYNFWSNFSNFSRFNSVNSLGFRSR
jgi:hypothetical protein